MLDSAQIWLRKEGEKKHYTHKLDLDGNDTDTTNMPIITIVTIKKVPYYRLSNIHPFA
jgi:hypothetical protein